jgi:hypothetical protein
MLRMWYVLRRSRFNRIIELTYVEYFINILCAAFMAIAFIAIALTVVQLPVWASI